MKCVYSTTNSAALFLCMYTPMYALHSYRYLIYYIYVLNICICTHTHTHFLYMPNTVRRTFRRIDCVIVYRFIVYKVKRM